MAGRNERGVSVVPALLALSIVLFVCMVGAHVFKPKSPADSDGATGSTGAAGTTAAHSDPLDAEPYRSSSTELAAAQARPSATVDPEWIRRMEIAADRIDTLIRRGRRRALAIPEASVDAGLHTSGAREATRRWNDFVLSWSESVDDMGEALPDHPGWDSGTDMVMAHQEMGQALNELRNVGFSAASTNNIPFIYERESRFDQAEFRLEQAREHLAKLQESY